jgi:hypothetical protein
MDFSTKRTSEHCLGTFITGDIVSWLLPQEIFHYLPPLSLSCFIGLNDFGLERERHVNNCSRKVGETEKSWEKRRTLYSRGGRT